MKVREVVQLLERSGWRVVQLLERSGWREVRIKGSHRHFRHPDKPLLVTVPGNEGKQLAPGTLNAILKKAGLK